MHHSSTLSNSTAEIESSILGVLLSAENTRHGVSALLDALAPALDNAVAAIAARDRDGLTLHVLAETEHSRAWPACFEPQFAVGAQPGVDSATGVMVVPLRSSGRVVGALLLRDAPHAAALLGDAELQSLLESAAAVLHALTSRTDSELRRRAIALRSVDAIVEGMAHQMANPLTGASAMAQLLEEEMTDESQRSAVQQIRQELSRAFVVLHDILDFQRDTRAHDGFLDLSAFAERVVRFRGYAIREQGIVIDMELSADYLPVRADARELEHAMLLALRFAELRSSGTVNRRLGVKVLQREGESGELAVEIADSGAGDMPQLTPLFFDIPFRSEHPVRPSTDEQPDLGLVDSILRGCGGRLGVRATKEDGTTLILILPRAMTPGPAANGGRSA